MGPGRAERGGPIPDAHRSHAGLECGAKCSVIVAKEIFRCAVPRKRFGDLARKPLCRWVSGHRNPQQLPPSMAENKKREQLLKRNRRNHKEINRRNPLCVIANEGLPCLQWPIRSGHHIDRNRGLSDLDAELEQLAMDLGSAPQRVLTTHSSDEVAYLLADLRSAPEWTGFPSPVGGKAPSMTTYYSLGHDDPDGGKSPGIES